MTDEYIISGLSVLGIDIRRFPSPEIAQFLDLASGIKKEDFNYGIEFVNTRNKLQNASPMDRFKYLCGYLQKIKKVYQYQNYGKQSGMDKTA